MFSNPKSRNLVIRVRNMLGISVAVRHAAEDPDQDEVADEEQA
jgi:hypothetical protein